jgi:hypothetical protein
MSHGDTLEPVLAALASDNSTEFGAPGAQVAVLREIDGPFSSVRHVRITTPSGSKTAYIKVLKTRRPGQEEAEMIDRMLKREYLATSALYKALGQDERLGAVRPVAWLPEHRALVTEEVPGRQFGELLIAGERTTEELAAMASDVGRWIRLYQSLVESTGVVDLAERRAYVDERLVRLSGRVLSDGDRQATLNRFDALVRDIGGPSLPAVAMHADLNPLNIIVGDKGRITVLDFTMAKSGTIYHDLSHLYFHLALLAERHRGRRAAVQTIQRALLGGYAPGLSPEDPLFRLMLLVHGVCHVALMAERKLPILDGAYRWFMRRRWRVCERIPAQADVLRVA